jgi:hypothetical protein
MALLVMNASGCSSTSVRETGCKRDRTNVGERMHGQEWKTKRERMKTEKKGGKHPN